MKGTKMMLALIIFFGGFIMAVAAVVIYTKSENTSDESLFNLINSTRADMKKIMPGEEMKKNFDELNERVKETAMKQATIEDKCLAALDEKTAKLFHEIDKLGKENEILRVRLTSVDKRFRELPRTVTVKIEDPVKVDVISRARPQTTLSPGAAYSPPGTLGVPKASTFYGAGSSSRVEKVNPLLNKAGIVSENPQSFRPEVSDELKNSTPLVNPKTLPKGKPNAKPRK